MKNITITQEPAFNKSYRRLHDNQKEIVDIAINDVINNPKIGQIKKGNLAGIYVYKFQMHHLKMLLAYKWFPKERLLLFLGTHENFHRDLKNRI